MAITPVLANYEWIDAGPDGGSFNGPGPTVLVIHSTEGSTLAGAVRAYQNRGVPPQLTISPKEKRRAQHIRLDRSGYALRNRAGGVETNRRGGIIQVEIVGFAGQSHDWPDEDLVFIGEALRPIICGGELRDFPRFWGSGEGVVLATPSAPQRFSYAAWNSFHGICGHQHVPENDHWDPGKLNVARILEVAWGAPAPSPVPMPNPTPTPPPSGGDSSLLRQGSKGDAVMRWQRRLNAERGAGLIADGDFGARTHNATVSFQRAVGIGADGIVGPASRSKMDGLEGRSVATIRKGSNGSLVVLWQNRLNAYTGAGLVADGDFGSATHAKTLNFQNFFNLGADGIVGPKTDSTMRYVAAVSR